MIDAILAATGHRPDKLGGYGTRTNDRCVRLAAVYLAARQYRIAHVISGMAMGWDLGWAEAAITLGIPVVAAIPFPQQANTWSDQEKQRYETILGKCARVQIISAIYDPAAYQKRNIWMVDNCHELIALWNGSPGGTGNCIRYAKGTSCLVDNLWSKWNG